MPPAFAATASARSTSHPSNPRPRASAQRRACKVSGNAAVTRRRPAAIPSGGDGRAGYAHLGGSTFSSFSLHPSAFRSFACGSVWLENPSGGIPLAGEGGSLSVGPPAEVLPARSALPRDKRGARNSGQGRGSPVVGRAARLFRLLPAAGAAEERGESWESRQVVALVGARTCRLYLATAHKQTPRVPTRERRMP